MTARLELLDEWIPERMDPGTLFVLSDRSKLSSDRQQSYVAVLACPRCGAVGLITRNQLLGNEAMICGGEACSAEFRLHGEVLHFRQPQ